MRHPFSLLLAALFVVMTVAGCRCNDGLNRKAPVLIVDRELIDFGTVQINLEHVQKLIVRNDGNSTLTLSDPVIVAPFTVNTTLPLTLEIGGETDVLIGYKPTVANQVNEGTLTFKTDDPQNVTKTINLRGQGIQAVANVTPNPINFGDVYVAESKAVTVTLTNSGSNVLNVVDVALAPGTTAGITGDFSPLRVSLPAGGSSTTTIAFTPQDIVNVAGALRFTFDPLQGGQVDIPFAGRGIRAKTYACFKFVGAGTEQCTDPEAPTAFLSVPFGALCDDAINPRGTDGGCTALNGERTGTLYLRNDGNVPMKFSAEWEPNSAGNKNPCDAGTVPPPDFLFSNTPDAGAVFFATATVQTPALVMDPKPWETPPVSITYRPTSRCFTDTGDQGRVKFVRQGEPFNTNRPPTTIFITMNGSSALPNAQKSDLTTQPSASQLPNAIPFVGVINQGTAPMTVNAVNLFEELTDAGVGSGPTGGVLVACSATSAPTSPCLRFAWAANGNPNNNVPITVNPNDGGTTPPIGSLIFGPDGGSSCPLGACINQTYTVYAVIDTSDPYHAQIVSRVSATAR